MKKVVASICCLLLLPLASTRCLAQPDPRSDGWETEALSATIQDGLKKLVAETLGGATGDAGSGSKAGSVSGEALQIDLAADARCAVVRDGFLKTTRDDRLVFARALMADQQPVAANEPLRSGLTKLLSPLRNEDGTPSDATRFRLKVSRIRIENQQVRVRALLYATNKTKAGSIQLNSTWETVWVLGEATNPTLLRAINVLAYEEVLLKSPTSWFTDVTAAVFAGDRTFQEQVMLGMNSWLNRVERFGTINIYSRHGLAVGDANGDGLDDVYLCQPGGIPNRLFLQQQDGRLADHSAKSRVDWLNDTRSALFVDLDNDGDQDLVVGTFVGLFVCRNLGEGVYEEPEKLPGVGRDISSLSAVDYDLDGDLDIHVCVYNSEAKLEGRDIQSVYDASAKGGVNRLFENQSGNAAQWSFQDVTFEVGLKEGNARFSLAAAWEDYDNDGDQDLYIANDFGINCLYRNEGGRFTYASAELGVEDYGPGMSAAWGDYNRDGRPDLYVANMFSAAGNRVTRQQQFQSDAEGTTRESFQRFNKGNSLYTFDGNRFQEVPGAAGAENALWAWSSLLADIDNDGWQDALVANGYITGPGGGDL